MTPCNASLHLVLNFSLTRGQVGYTVGALISVDTVTLYVHNINIDAKQWFEPTEVRRFPSWAIVPYQTYSLTNSNELTLIKCDFINSGYPEISVNLVLPRFNY